MNHRTASIVRILLIVELFPLGCLVLTSPCWGQSSGAVSGRVTHEDGSPLSGVLVTVPGTGLSVSTAASGRYRIAGIPAGTHVVQFAMLGFAPREMTVAIQPGTAVSLDAVLQTQAIVLSAITVHGVSRAPDRMIDAPAAITVAPRPVMQAVSPTGQFPLALAHLPGMDVAQNGVNDFNVNARGFNASLVRSMVVLQDGRDLSIPLLGSQEWAALSQPLEDVARIEVVRGPGSALYGANAFSGVIDIRTPAAREIVGTKLSVAGGELGTLRADLRHAGVTRDARFGYRVNAGYGRSDDWSKSRTRRDGSDLATEYAGATDSVVRAPPPGFELTPLRGQTTDPATGAALGTPDPLVSSYGSARLDYYAPNRSIVTVDGGASQVENGVFLTSIGRVQVLQALRPWSRISWEGNSFSLSGWYSGRSATEPQRALSSGLTIDDNSAVLHAEGRVNRSFLQNAARVIVGATAQDSRVNTDGTLMDPSLDDRSDKSYAAYTQLEYAPFRPVRFTGALRWDTGDLYAGRISPKAAVVVTPVPNHAVRLGFNRAFLTPSLTQLFLRVSAGTQNFNPLEAALRASPLGPALAGVPSGELFTTSAAVPVWAFGKSDLVPETVNSYELGYKGQIGERVFVSADSYYSHITDFVTSLLPATVLNPEFAPWTAPPAVPAQYRAPLEAAVKGALAGTTAEYGLTRLSDGSTAIVVSNGNAGVVNEWGVELGTNISIGRGVTLGGSYTYFNFTIKQAQAGDVLLPNTPRHKGTISLAYAGPHGADFSIDARLVGGYSWSVGVYRGYVPASQIVNLSAGYRVTPNLRLQAIGTNILDQRRFQMFGGSVIGRRVLAGVTTTF